MATGKKTDPPTGPHKAKAPPSTGRTKKPDPAPAPASSPDPFAGEDPIDAVMPPGGAPPAPNAGGDDDFDALGFDTSFGASPVAAAPPVSIPIGEHDETPPAGVFLGEDVQVLSAQTIGRALAEAEGLPITEQLPDMTTLQADLIGIDVGASAAVVACFNEDGQHEIVPNEDEERATPLQLFFDEDGERLVGQEARRMAPSAPARAIVDLKEMIADPFFRLNTGGEEIDSQTVLGMVLERLLEDVERFRGKRPTHVALAAPAWFAETQRETLRRAVEKTGVTLVGITEEALAAAVPYSLRLPDLNPRVALVFDLGHAALGVGVVRCAGGDITVLAQDARRELGSARWDLLLAQEAARKFKEKFQIDPMQDKGGAIDLKLRAEDAKRELSRRMQVTLTVSAQGKALKVGFTRQGFEDAARGLVEKSLAFARDVRDRAGIKDWKQVDALLLTGGGSRTPIIRTALSTEVGREPERAVGAEDGVAIGALYWGTLERHRKSRA